MKTIKDITNEYQGKIDFLDLELIIANSLNKTREFVLSNPEYKISSRQSSVISHLAKRRISKEPIAHILGHKEFYGLDFIVNKYTLVPRPETEQIVELTLREISNLKSQISTIHIIDVGTGSGNIIVSIANLDSRLHGNDKVRFFGIDISSEALKVAKKNAKLNGVDKKIKFLHGSLLMPIIQNSKFEIRNSRMIILANLPYLSKEIYNSAPIDVKKFEPKSALYSPEAGLKHYKDLLLQIKKLRASCSMLHVSCYLEISPEQKIPLTKIIKTILPKAKIEFKKDLAGKWRVCKIELT